VRLARLIRRHDVRLVFTSKVSVLAEHSLLASPVGPMSGSCRKSRRSRVASRSFGHGFERSNHHRVTILGASIHRGRPRRCEKLSLITTGVDVSVYDSADGSAFRRKFSTAERPLLIGWWGACTIGRAGLLSRCSATHSNNAELRRFRALHIVRHLSRYENLALALQSRRSVTSACRTTFVFCGHLRQIGTRLQSARRRRVSPQLCPNPSDWWFAEAMAAARASSRHGPAGRAK
jgi:hypothetical protein